MIKSVFILLLWMGFFPFTIGEGIFQGVNYLQKKNHVKNQSKSHNKQVRTSQLKRELKHPLLAYMYGVVVMFGIFQCIALPMIFARESLHILTNTWAAIILILVALSGVILVKSRFLMEFFNETFESIKGFPWQIWLSIAVIALQTAFVTVFMHIDDDDANYVGTAVTSWTTDTMFYYSHNTGGVFQTFPVKYALAPFPIFEAMLAKLCDIHPAILAHTLLPAILIPMSYMVMALIATRIWKKDLRSIGLFLLFMFVLNSFGYQSTYTTSAFLMLRVWQGKAILANIILPFIFYLLMRMIRKDEIEPIDKDGKTRELKIRKILDNTDWIMLFFAVLAGTSSSSMGVPLIPIVIGATSLVAAINRKKPVILLKGFLVCIPCCILGIIYIMVK